MKRRNFTAMLAVFVLAPLQRLFGRSAGDGDVIVQCLRRTYTYEDSYHNVGGSIYHEFECLDVGDVFRMVNRHTHEPYGDKLFRVCVSQPYLWTNENGEQVWAVQTTNHKNVLSLGRTNYKPQERITGQPHRQNVPAKRTRLLP